jgi:D-alanyl-D-alanine carboxypeptidase/D-alanyl-D-alanine-endopeptidase (penicillin-binding protein 4)
MIKNNNYRFFLRRVISACPLLCVIILPAFLYAAGTAVVNPLSDSIQALLARRGYKQKTVGIAVRAVNDSQVIADVNGSQRYNPASVSKLITASAALDLLGTGYRFATMAYAGGPVFRDSGVLSGDLYIRGGGDPGFTAERLWLFARQIYNSGIRRIEHDLVLDESFFDNAYVGPGFNEDNSSRAYEAPAAALSASFNTVSVIVSPGNMAGSPVLVNILPAISGIKIHSTGITAKTGGSSDIQVKTEVSNGRTAVFVSGTMSETALAKTAYCKVWETWENFGSVMKGLFEECGITFSGVIRCGTVPDSILAATPLLVFESQPLFETIRPMFKVSSNFAAEMLFKTMAAEKAGAPGTWDSGSKLVEKWWVDSGLPGRITVLNGSGMGNENRISPVQITFLLERMWNNKSIMPDFLSALPLSNVDGTLEKRFSGSRLAGKIRAKTGTLNNYGVSSLAGYVLLGEKTWVFAIIINGAGADQYRHWETQQKILEMVFPVTDSVTSK